MKTTKLKKSELNNKRSELRSDSSRIAYQISLVNKRIRECKSHKLRKELLGIQWKLRSTRAKIGAEIGKLNKKISELPLILISNKGRKYGKQQMIKAIEGWAKQINN
jgi:hypothetical protein